MYAPVPAPIQITYSCMYVQYGVQLLAALY